MAAYTSTQNGDWDDVNTWGGGGYPSAAGDTASLGHIVNYNVASTTELGAITINSGGILTFDNSMSTKLTLGHVDLAIAGGGELRVGASGAIIPKDYTAELIWNTTSDNAKGYTLANGGKITVYGDPDYFGSVNHAILASQSPAIPTAGNSVTITVVGDVTTKWQTGHEIWLHKGAAYSDVTNDWCRLSITSLIANGADTDIVCNVLERPGSSLNCLIGADVLHLSRNVIFSKLGCSSNIYNFNSNRPRVTNSNAANSNNVNLHDLAVIGWRHFAVGHGVIFDGVFRNGLVTIDVSYMAQLSGITVATLNGAAYGCYHGTINGWIGNCNNVINNTSQVVINAHAFGCYYGYLNSDYVTFNGCLYSIYGTLRANYGCVHNNNFGYDENGVSKNNYQGINCGSLAIRPKVNVINALVDMIPFGRNSLSGARARVRFVHYQKILNSHYIWDNMGDISKVKSGATGSPPSGAASYLKVYNPQSNLISTVPLEIIIADQFQIWQPAGTVVYKIYVQAPTGNNSDYSAADLVLSAKYISGSSPLAISTISSSGGITRANDWSQYLSVSVTSVEDGFVELTLNLNKYYAAGDVLYVDSGIYADSNVLAGDWSMGELVYPGPSTVEGGGGGGGGGVSPIQPTLTPLGVMEVVA